MSLRPLTRSLGILMLVLACPLAALAQAPTESDLLAKLQQQPGDVAVALDLAKLYAQTRRFDDALGMLQRATLLIRQQQTAAATRVMTDGVVFTPVQLTPARSVPSLDPTTSTGANAMAATNQSMPQAPIRVGGDIKEPLKIRDVKPVYPETAMAAGVQGIVIMEAVIGTDGSVTSARVLRGIPLLDQAALDAVQQWQFTPTLLNGMAINVIMTVTVNFTLK